MGFFRRRQRADEIAASPQSPYTAQETATLQWEFGLPEDDQGKFTRLDSHHYTLHESSTTIEIQPDYRRGASASQWAATPLTKPGRNADDADSRLQAMRTALDHALEEWWSDGQLPSPALLRDGLLTLVAGQDLDEGQRSLLLRTALTYQRGMITALRYQTDGERTAFMLKEMLLNLQFPFPPALVWQLRQEDEKSDEWAPLLLEELRYELPLVEGLQHQQTQSTLDYLEGRKTPVPPERPSFGAPSQLLDAPELAEVRVMNTQPYWSYGRLLIVALLTLLSVGAILSNWQPSAAASTLTIPADQYVLLPTAGATLPRTTALTTFTIDRDEVTNRAYQRCYRAGACPPPAELSSNTRPHYFAEAAFGDFPVVNVTWEAAQTYCTWLGKQLPTADQWEVAASVAPATHRAARYPWGDQFDPRLANTAASGFGDTQPIGTYHPNGDSSFGLVDMAGNVAEWTATPVTEGSQEYVVKGGSFQDASSFIMTTARETLDRQFYAPWLGFRCSEELPE